VYRKLQCYLDEGSYIDYFIKYVSFEV